MQHFKQLGFALLLSITILTSCEKDDDNEPSLIVKGDVLVEKKMDGEVIKYAPSFYVYSNKELKSASVKAPGTDGKTYTLVATSSSNQQFKYKAAPADFMAEAPTAGDYTFTVTDKTDEVKSVIDKISAVSLNIAQISEATVTTNKLTMKWAAVANADAFVVKLYDQANTLLYMSVALAPTTTTLSFANTDSGWLTTTKGEDGKTYQVDLEAIKFESNALSYEIGYNLEVVSIAQKQIIWAK